MYETKYEKSQPFFGEKFIQLHYMDTDSFVLGIFNNNVIKDLNSSIFYLIWAIWIKIMNYILLKRKKWLKNLKEKLLKLFF